MSLDLVRLLAKDLDDQRTPLENLTHYFAGTQPLSFLHPQIETAVGDRLRSLVVNWPRVIVRSISERLYVEGFRLGGSESANDDLWRLWQANDLDEWSQLCHDDALIHGRSFVSVWADPEDADVPRIAVESAQQVTVRYAPGTRNVVAALKRWSEVPDLSKPGVVDHVAVLYLPDEIQHWRAHAAAGVLSQGVRWELEKTLENPLGEVPIVPIVNQPQLTNLAGTSELADVVPLADALNKLATDMMVSSEYHAMPRRWITGMEIPRDTGQKTRLQAEVQREMSEAFPGKPWLGGKDVNFGQFPEAQLDNFINGIKLLTSQIAAIAGLPPHFLGMNADNPASADAIRSAESSLVMKAKAKQRAFGGPWERVMRLAVAVRDGEVPGEMRQLETVWRDPETPTPAQKADAALKLTQGERPIITVNQAREDLGYTPGQIDRMQSDEEAAAAQAATADVRARVAEARRLQQEDGLSQAAAYAAVGLLVAAGQISTDAA